MQVGQISTKNNNRYELQQDELELLPIYTRATARTSIPATAKNHINNLKNIENELSKFKLSKNEVRVYLYLARFGAHKAQSIAKALEIHRTETYKILGRIESQGLITRVMERPMKFLAIPFEQVLDNLIEERRQRIHKMEQNKVKLLEIWKSLPEPKNVSKRKETFQILEGKRHIGVKLNELLSECEESFRLLVSDMNLIWLFNTPFLDELEEVSAKKNTDIKVLTNYSPTSSYVMDQISLGNGDFAYIKKQDMAGFFILDNNELILLMSNDQNNLYGMWTNYSSIVKSYSILFDLLWKNK